MQVVQVYVVWNKRHRVLILQTGRGRTKMRKFSRT